jgi:hypothetical protein
MQPYTDKENTWLSSKKIIKDIRLVNDQYFITIGISKDTIRTIVQYTAVLGFLILVLTMPSIIWFLKSI